MMLTGNFCLLFSLPHFHIGRALISNNSKECNTSTTGSKIPWTPISSGSTISNSSSSSSSSSSNNHNASSNDSNSPQCKLNSNVLPPILGLGLDSNPNPKQDKNQTPNLNLKGNLKVLYFFSANS